MTNNRIKNKFLRIFLAVGLFGAAFVQAKFVDEISCEYQNSIDCFQKMQTEQLQHDHMAMVQLFSYFDTTSVVLLKQLSQDIDLIKKELKKNQDDRLQKLYEQLQQLRLYVKRHKINNDAIVFQKELQQKYQQLFDMVADDQDVITYIDQNRSHFGINKDDKNFLKTFLNDTRQYRHRVSQFEDYIHADYVDLKLMNYVFKIELVRLRNAILFDKRYKK